MQRINRNNYRSSALAILLIALVFYGFFDFSKHNPASAAVNPFGEDPFDAVGSFGVQVAGLAALLAGLRAFRPYPAGELPVVQAQFTLRAEAVALLGIVVTLAADGVGMARDPFMWMRSAAGWQLAGLVAALALVTLWAGWRVYKTARSIETPGAKRPWRPAVLICLAGLFVLAFYPPGWRASAPGAVLAALTGMAVLMVTVWALAGALFPLTENEFEDVFDDLAALYAWARSRLGAAQPVFRLAERLAVLRWVHIVVGWINPRRHAWSFVVLIAAGMGVAMLLAEALGEGGFQSLRQFVLVAAIFIVIECCGVGLGYGLLARGLGIFRPESRNMARGRSSQS